MVAEVIGTPVAIALGTSATPGAQNITVPPDAEGAVVFWSYWHANSQNGLLSISSNFSGAFTTGEVPTGGSGWVATGIAYADVTSTGAKTITPAWDTAPGEGPVFIVAFIKGMDTDWVRDTAFDQADGATAVSATVNSTPSDLVMSLDQRWSAGSPSGPPSNETGWSSLQTQDNNSEGGRLRSADSPGASTTTANGQEPEYSTISGISIISGTGGAPVDVDLSPMELVYEQSADMRAASLLALSPMELVYEQSADMRAASLLALSPMELVYEQSADMRAASLLALSPMELFYEQSANLVAGQTVDLSPMELFYEQSANLVAGQTVDLSPMELFYEQSANLVAGQTIALAPMELVYEQAAAATLSTTIALAPMAFTLDQIAALIYGNVLTLAPMEFVYSQIAGIGAGGAVGLSPMAFEYAQGTSVSISATRQLAPMDFAYNQSAAVAAPVSMVLDAMEFVYLFNAVAFGGLSEGYKATVTFSSARTYGRKT